MDVVSLKVTRNATILVLDFAVIGALNYGFWLLLARITLLEVSGGVATIFSLIMIFTSLVSPGIPMATSKYVSEHISRRNPNTVRTVIKSAIILVLLLTSIVAVLLVLLADRIAGIYDVSGITTPLKVSALIIALFPLLAIFNSIYQGFQKMEYRLSQDLLVAGSRFFLGLGLVFFGFEVIGPVLGVIIGGFGAIFLAFFFILRLLRRTQDHQAHSSEKNTEKDLFKSTDLLRLGLPNNIIFGMIRLPSQAGTLFIGLFGGTLATVSMYYLSIESILTITLISNAIGIALLPAVSYAWVNNSTIEFEFILNLCLRYFFVIISPIVMIAFFFSEEVILLILGRAYLPAIPIFRILLLAVPAIGMLQIFISVLTGIGSTKWLIRLSLLLLSAYIILAVGLTTIFGQLGPSGAFTCSIAIGALATFWMTQKATKMHIDLVILAKILVPCTVFLLLTIILISFFKIYFLLALSLAFAIYMILSFVIGTFTREDIAFFKNLLGMMTETQIKKGD